MHIQPPKKKNKHKHKQSRTQDPVPPGTGLRPQPPLPSCIRPGASAHPHLVPPETPSDSDHKKKKKKKEEDPERKRKKKEKKKKKVGGEPGLGPPVAAAGAVPWAAAMEQEVSRARVCPSSTEPAQPGAPGRGQLPGQRKPAVRPRSPGRQERLQLSWEDSSLPQRSGRPDPPGREDTPSPRNQGTQTLLVLGCGLGLLYPKNPGHWGLSFLVTF